MIAAAERPSDGVAAGRRPPSQGRRPSRLALDLFSGTGGATAALRSRPGWRVITVDNRPSTEPDVVADVQRPPWSRETLPPGSVDFLWASPPCQEFSLANPRVDHSTKRPSLELVGAVLEVVAQLRPRFWILENVRGAIPFLGVPAQKIGPWCLWGYFPHIDPPYGAQTWTKDGTTSEERAAVPWALSLAVARAVDRHLHVPSILDLRPFRRHRHRESDTRTKEQLRLFEPGGRA